MCGVLARVFASPAADATIIVTVASTVATVVKCRAVSIAVLACILVFL